MHGLVELVWLPYQQYQEDGRIMWGLTRGASAFTSSTGVAVVELSSRLLQSVQSVAQMAYDMVTPTECPSQALVHHHHKPHQPKDFREGFANAYDVVSAVSHPTTLPSKRHYSYCMLRITHFAILVLCCYLEKIRKVCKC